MRYIQINNVIEKLNEYLLNNEVKNIISINLLKVGVPHMVIILDYDLDIGLELDTF